ncbi:MAG: ABC transporter substrate-binding protein, partial [Halobaculum sp.]
MTDETNTTNLSRRRLLQTGGAGVTALSTGLSGCLGGGGSTTTLTLGTINVFPMMQYFVIDQQGWYEDELDVEIDVKTF